jgi:hypothetical protein
MIERIDTYWHEHRLMSRAVAIRELLERGLKPDQPDEPAD